MVNRLIENFSKNYLKYVCIIENLKSKDKEVLYLSKTSVAFKILPSNIVMIAGEKDLDKAVLSVADFSATFFSPEEEVKVLLEKKGLKPCRCKQYLYGVQQVENAMVDFKKLLCDDETIDFVQKNYSLGYTKEQVSHVLSDRALYGGFVNGEICGFVGVHEELSVGLLEVLEKFKRKGIGSFLLKTCVNEVIKSGYTAFCHVRSENVASIELHKKLNCQPYSEEVYWF
jgi:tRNA (guanine37-N1)-methyltransferase